MKLKNQYKGIFYIILSAFCFALMDMFVRMAGELPSIQKSFFRNFVAAVFACGILIKEKKSVSIGKESWGYLILRSVFGTLGILCNFYAVDHLALADASMLNKMSPFFAVVFSVLILREKVSIPQITMVLGAFVGSLFVIKPTVANMDLVPSLMGLLGGIGAGAAYTMVRKLGSQGVKGPFIVFFFSMFSCVVTLPWLIFDYHPMTGGQIVILLLAGLRQQEDSFLLPLPIVTLLQKRFQCTIIPRLYFPQCLDFLSLDRYRMCLAGLDMESSALWLC